MAGIILKHKFETEDDIARVVFELIIPSEDAPSRKTKSQFSIFHHPPSVGGKKRPQLKKLATRSVSMGKVAVSEVGKPAPPLDEDPLRIHWFISAPISSFLGELVLQGEWKAKSDDRTIQFEERIPAGTSLGPEPIEIFLNTAVPRIGSRINEVAPQVVEASATDEGGKAVEIMEHVQHLLDEGLEPVWSSIEGLPTRDGKPLMAADPSDFTEEELEEAWAQLLSERLVGTPYAGPGINHFGNALTGDEKLFSQGFNSSDPAYPIIFACQHLCTAAAVSRGVKDAAALPIDARSAANASKWNPSGEINKDKNNTVATTAIENEILKPGTIYVANDVAHVAFVLRVFKAGRMQLIDTGGMKTEPAPLNPFGVAGSVDFSDSSLTMGGINFDTGLVNKITRPLKHLAVLPPSNDLKGAIELMKKARPLGIVRFMILDRVSDSEAAKQSLASRLRFASPLLPMWFRDQNYSILRLLWSLRSHPHRDKFEARWWVAFPQHQVASEMLKSRNFSWPEVITAAKQRKPPTSPNNLLHPAVYLGSTENGQVRFIGRFSTVIETEENDKGEKTTTTVGTWFDAVQNKTFKRPNGNAITPTLKERNLPLDELCGVTNGATPKDFDKLLNIDISKIPDYLKSVAK